MLLLFQLVSEKGEILHVLVKNILLYCIYKFSKHEIIFFSKSQPRVYSNIFLKFQPRYSYKTYSYIKRNSEKMCPLSSPKVIFLQANIVKNISLYTPVISSDSVQTVQTTHRAIFCTIRGLVTLYIISWYCVFIVIERVFH